MDELIKELKENKENKIDKKYLIERLENINILWEYVKGEILFNIESLINENYMESDDEFKKLEALTNKDIEKITNSIYNQDWLWDTINETMNETILKELETYINNK